MTEEEKYYREKVWPRVLASIAQWVQEFPQQERDRARKDFLLAEIEKVREAFIQGCAELALRKDDLTYWSEKRLASLEKRMYKLGMDVKIVTGRLESISPEMIARARRYPIDTLVTVRHGKALCPFHNDKHPSMDVRKNFYYCYSCNASGDVIDLAMHVRGITFKEAVNQLQ